MCKSLYECAFLSLEDLSNLLIRMIDNWNHGSGVLSVGDEFHLTFSDFADGLRKIDPDVKTEFSESQKSNEIKLTNTALRNEYGWFAKISLVEDLEEEYARYL